jgi:hypothetical protein
MPLAKDVQVVRGEWDTFCKELGCQVWKRLFFPFVYLP